MHKAAVYVMLSILSGVAAAVIMLSIPRPATASTRPAVYRPDHLVYGSYDPVTGQIICSDLYTCRHELGHWQDAELGHPSVYPGWQDVVCKIYREAETKPALTRLDMFIASYPGVCGNSMLIVAGYEPHGGYQELYADIYAVYGGEVEQIPERVRAFYKAK